MGGGELRFPTDQEWASAALFARQHRLGPHLHARMGRGEIACDVPPAYRARWERAYRASALQSLVQRDSLSGATDTLAKAGIQAVVLKGAWLAYHAYPHPAERPMRDLDLLVAQDDLIRAYHVLKEAGWDGPDAGDDELARIGFAHNHLPPLRSPEGVMLELHGKLWAAGDRAAGPMPRGIEQEVLAQPMTNDGIAYPRPGHMLAHLCVHAVYSHGLNVGPLLLSDIDYLLREHIIDWTTFRRNAEANGYASGAAIVLALVDRWRRPGLLHDSGFAQPLSKGGLNGLSLLLCQDMRYRQDVVLGGNLLSGWRANGLSGLIGAARRSFHRDMRDSIGGTLAKSRSMRFVEVTRAALRHDIWRSAGRRAQLDRMLGN